MKTTNVLIGVIAGAAVGAIMGILFAPDKGSNTRKKILSKGEDLAEGMKDKVNFYRDQAADVVDRFADKIHTPEPEMKGKGDNSRKYTHAEK